MSIFTSFLVALTLSFAGIASLQSNAESIQTLSFRDIDFNFVLYFIIVIGSTKLLTYALTYYLLSFSNSSCLNNRLHWNKKLSLGIYLECLILYAIFSSNTLKDAILSYKLDKIEFESMNLLTQLTTGILIPFSYISLLVILLSSGISLLNHTPKGLVYKEINLVLTSLVLLLSICIVVQNYYAVVN